MSDSVFGGGEWIFAFLIIAVLFGGGNFGFGGGNNAAYATMADINASNAAQTSALNQQSILLSSAQNNYETAQLISNQTMTYLNQNNTNLLTAINGFNAINQNIASGFAQTAQSIADLGYRMDRCCCEIKTQMLQDRLQDTQFALQNANDIANNASQSMYLISQLKTTASA
jgi:hypothetical protein